MRTVIIILSIIMLALSTIFLASVCAQNQPLAPGLSVAGAYLASKQLVSFPGAGPSLSWHEPVGTFRVEAIDPQQVTRIGYTAWTGTSTNMIFTPTESLVIGNTEFYQSSGNQGGAGNQQQQKPVNLDVKTRLQTIDFGFKPRGWSAWPYAEVDFVSLSIDALQVQQQGQQGGQSQAKQDSETLRKALWRIGFMAEAGNGPVKVRAGVAAGKGATHAEAVCSYRLSKDFAAIGGYTYRRLKPGDYQFGTDGWFAGLEARF
jgi:hypothetical protein